MLKANTPTNILRNHSQKSKYQNSKEKNAKALLTEGKREMTEGAKNENTVAVKYMRQNARAPVDPTTSVEAKEATIERHSKILGSV